MLSRNRGFLFLLCIVAVVVIFYNIGTIPLLDPDEPVYAETPKEMIKYNEYLSPRIYGEYWYDKPPMYYWLVAGSYKIFGINEFAARFPSAFLAVLSVLVMYYYGSKLFNKRAAACGALVLVTSLEFFYLGKAAVTDITLNFCLMVSLLAFINRQYYIFYIFAGLATLTKGPVGLLFPGAILFLYFLFSGRWQEMKHMKILSGVLVFSLVALPWYIYMYINHGNAFVETFLGFHNITRFTSPEHPETVWWYYYIPVLILGFFPWSAVMVQSVWKSFTDSRHDYPQLLYLNIWAAFIFVFFTISQTKLVSYILPMFPPLALIVGWNIDRLWDYRRSQRIISWPLLYSILTILLGTGMFLGLKYIPELTNGVIAVLILFSISLTIVWFFIWQRDMAKVFWVKVITGVVFSLILLGIMFPQAAPRFTAKYIAQSFIRQYDGKSPIYVTKFLHPGFTFYSELYGTEVDAKENVAKLIKAVNKPGPSYFILMKKDFEALADQTKQLRLLETHDEKLLLYKP